MSMSSTQNSDRRVRVRFVTKEEKYAVTDVAIAIPAKLNSKGLNEVISHLMGSDSSGANGEKKDFDFKIGNVLLRESVDSFMQKYGLSNEHVTEIEYFTQADMDGEQQSEDQEAWVGCIDASVEGSGCIYTGCYDGSIKIAKAESLTTVTSVLGHNSHPIRGIRATDRYLITGSKDHTMKCFAIKNGMENKSKGGIKDMNVSLMEVGITDTPSSSVESVDIDAARDLALCGEYNGNISGYNLKSCLDESNTTVAFSEVLLDGPNRKKKKGMGGEVETSQVKNLNAAFSMRAHAQCVTGLQIVSSRNRLYTCSYDHTVKIWDMERQDCISTIGCPKVATSVHWSESNSLIATSHPDGKVRIWHADSKNIEEGNGSVGVYGGKKAQWISQVKWAPSNEHIFSCVDYNGSVTLWDIRATQPLSSTEAHTGKGLCLDWVIGTSKIATGGSDCILHACPIRY